MAFINEYISAEDIKKYDLENINKKFVVGNVPICDWVINRERDIYLRVVARSREEFSHESTWVFYWHGVVIVVELENLSTNGVAGGERSGHKRIRKIDLPSNFKDRRSDILADLKEALIAYKDGGVFATATSYTLDLEICEEGAE